MRLVQYEKLELPVGVTEKVYEFNNCLQGDVSIDELDIQKTADVVVAFTGYMDENDTVGTAMSAEDVSRYEVIEQPTKAGIFTYLTTSLQRCKITFTATAATTVYLKYFY